MALAAFFYLYFAGRLAYTFLQAGLYLVAIFQLGHAAPTRAVWEAEGLFAAIVLGVVVADVVTWVAGVEGDLSIRFGDTPLWPLRRRVAEPEPDAGRHGVDHAIRGPCD